MTSRERYAPSAHLHRNLYSGSRPRRAEVAPLALIHRPWPRLAGLPTLDRLHTILALYGGVGLAKESGHPVEEDAVPSSSRQGSEARQAKRLTALGKKKARPNRCCVVGGAVVVHKNYFCGRFTTSYGYTDGKGEILALWSQYSFHACLLVMGCAVPVPVRVRAPLAYRGPVANSHREACVCNIGRPHESCAQNRSRHSFLSPLAAALSHLKGGQPSPVPARLGCSVVREACSTGDDVLGSPVSGHPPM